VREVTSTHDPSTLQMIAVMSSSWGAADRKPLAAS
jgi:hypothetical protein